MGKIVQIDGGKPFELWTREEQDAYLRRVLGDEEFERLGEEAEKREPVRKNDKPPSD